VGVRRILAAALIALCAAGAQDAPSLYVVSARSEVLPGELFSVTVTTFGDVGPVVLTPGGLPVISQEQRGQTLYVTLRAEGGARDVRIEARAGDLSSSTVVRICCRAATLPINTVYLPTIAYTGVAQSEDTQVFIPVSRR
jgi:hypothetical protein